jgi:hypothetical protein
VVGTETHTRGRQVGSARGVQDDVLVLASLADPGVDKVPLGVLHGIAFNVAVALSTKSPARLSLSPAGLVLTRSGLSCRLICCRRQDPRGTWDRRS